MNSKHAYLIIAHKNFDQLQLLINALDDSRNDLYIHIDLKSDGFDQNRFYCKNASLFFIKRKRINWGGYSQIDCEIRLLQAATERNIYARYHLLSGLDLPIKSQDYIHSFFKNNEKEYIDFDTQNDSAERVQYYYPFQDIIGRNQGWYIGVLYRIQRCLIEFQKKYNFQRNQIYSLYKGTNWFSITDGLARYILNCRYSIAKQFKYTLCADEVFLQSVAMSSPFSNCIENESLRLIDWKRGNPYVFTINDLDLIKNSNDLFARKFDIYHDSIIVREIFESLLYPTPYRNDFELH